MTRKVLESFRRLISRRRTMQGAGALLTTTVACGDDGVAAGGDGSSSGSGGEAGTAVESGDVDGSTDDGGSTSGVDATGAASSSEGVGEGSSDEAGSSSTGEGMELTPEELLANVDHIIVLCMENRAFDHYFGARQLEEGLPDINGLDGSESNPDQNGDPVAVFSTDNLEPEDPPHGWGSCHAQWNDGANDGFVTEHFAEFPAEAAEVMGYHARDNVPVLYALADAYTVCDAWFCAVLGPTWPNRYYLHCVDSSGAQTNVPASPLPQSIQDLCSDNNISNRNYYDGLAAWRWGGFPLVGFAGTAGIGEFFDKLENGGLEQVVIIDPDFLSNDDHPAHNIQLGQALIGSVYTALANSQFWDRCLLIITYDEHGGFFDHVAPPTTVDDNPGFEQLGFRVPSVVIGPHVRKGFVNHTVFEHGSFAKTVSVRFGLPPLNARADAAADVSCCIDPDFVDDPQPPTPVPMMQIRESEVFANLGTVTSQPELFDAVGIEMPLSPARRQEHRRSVEALLAHAQRLGVVKLIRDGEPR